MISKLGHAGIKKPLDRVARLLEHAPVGGKARSLERELEPGRHFARPFAERCRRLAAVESAIDLDRGKPLGGVSELLRMRQALGIELTAPRFKGPAADADIDWARFSSHFPVIAFRVTLSLLSFYKVTHTGSLRTSRSCRSYCGSRVRTLL